METPETPQRPKSETMAIVQTVVASLNDVITALRSEVKALGEGERDARKRLYALLASVVFLSTLNIVGLVINHDQGNSIKATAKNSAKVASYVQDCLLTPAAKRDVTKCGADQGAAFIKGIIGSLNCSLLITPADRTEAKLNTCATKAFGG
jgi:hypothetical protein